MVVRDTHKDPRFADNGLVKGFPFIRFYSGVPLVVEIDGCAWALGTLCIIDVVPREWSTTEEKMLNSLGNIATNYLSGYVKSPRARETGHKTGRALRSNAAAASPNSYGCTLGGGLPAVLELLTPSLSQSQRHSSGRSRDSDIMSVPSGLATALALLSSMESREPLAISSGPTWEVLVVTDIDFQVVVVNPGWENLTGFKIHETIGNLFFDICSKNDDQGWKKSSEDFEFAVRATLDKGGGPNCGGWIYSSKTNTRGERQKVWLSASVTILDCFGSSITDRKLVVIRGFDGTIEKNAKIAMEEAKSAAESSMLARSRFLSNMSHELRTPINSIKLAALLMKGNVERNPEVQELSQMILQSSTHMMELVDQILMYSREENEIQNRGILRTSPPVCFDLRECVEQILESFSGQVASKCLELSYVMDDRFSGFVIADLTGVRQVLFNIIGNAVKFTETGSIDIDVELKQKNINTSLLKFKVADTGPGIDSIKLKKIFLPFEQADDSLTREKTGVGLGLSISRNIAESLGGKLTCSMQAERCVFTFEIPVDSSTKNVNAKVLRRVETIENVGKEIGGLVVCSSVSLRSSVVAILKYLGIKKIIVCESPSAVCVALEKSVANIDMILVDKPPMSSETADNWLECAQAIKSWSARNSESVLRIPLLMLKFFDNLSSATPSAKKRKTITRFSTDDATQEHVDDDADDESRWEALFDEINYERVNKPITAGRLRVPLEIALGGGKTTLSTNVIRETEKSSSDYEELASAALHVLLVEDNVLNSKVMGKLLKNIGCSNVSFAYNGAEAVKAVSVETFDIILMDLQMRVMDGIEASRQIMGEPKNCSKGVSPPIVVITADVTEEIEAQCMNAGVKAFLKKPVCKKDLVAALLAHAKKK
jgi:signal transduction histidine kinase/ActR/RegA family two-component response regulator